MPLAVTLAIQAMVAMALLTVPAMAPRVASALGVSGAYIGIFVAVSYLCATLASLASGALVARYGSIRVSQLCLVICAAGLSVCAVPSLWALGAGAVLVGLAYGPITPASSHLLSRTTPAHRMGLIFSIKQTGVPLGGALAGAIVPGLQALVGWQLALLLIGGACVLCVGCAQPLRAKFDSELDPNRELRLGGILEPVRLVLNEPPLRMLAACSFVFAVAQLSLTTYAVTYLTGDLGYGLVAAGAVFAVSQAAGVFGRVGWGYTADRWFGTRPMLAFLGTLMAACAGAVAMLHDNSPHAWVLVVFVLFGASATGWNGVYLAQVARVSPAGKAGMATGGTLAITFLGNVLGPALFAGVAGYFDSYRAGFVAVAAVLAVCSGALWIQVRRATSK